MTKSFPARSCGRCRYWTGKDTSTRVAECALERVEFIRQGWPAPSRKVAEVCDQFARPPSVREIADRVTQPQ